MLKLLRNQQGEIATALTIVAVAVMALGSLVGGLVAQRQEPLKLGSAAQEEEATCTDTDNGEVYGFPEGDNDQFYKQGVVVTTDKDGVETGSYKDNCRYANSVTVREYYCDNNLAKSHDYSCPGTGNNRCAEGACRGLGETPQPTPTPTVTTAEPTATAAPPTATPLPTTAVPTATVAPTVLPTEEPSSTPTSTVIPDAPTATTTPSDCPFDATAKVTWDSPVRTGEISATSFYLTNSRGQTIYFNENPFGIDDGLAIEYHPRPLPPELRGYFDSATLHTPAGWTITNTYCYGEGCPENVGGANQTINDLPLACNLNYSYGWSVLPPALQSPTPSPQPTGRSFMYGKVKRGHFGSLIPNAIVHLTSNPSAPQQIPPITVYTDSNGRYTTENAYLFEPCSGSGDRCYHVKVIDPVEGGIDESDQDLYETGEAGGNLRDFFPYKRQSCPYSCVGDPNKSHSENYAQYCAPGENASWATCPTTQICCCSGEPGSPTYKAGIPTCAGGQMPPTPTPSPRPTATPTRQPTPADSTPSPAAQGRVNFDLSYDAAINCSAAGVETMGQITNTATGQTTTERRSGCPASVQVELAPGLYNYNFTVRLGGQSLLPLKLVKPAFAQAFDPGSGGGSVTISAGEEKIEEVRIRTSPPTPFPGKARITVPIGVTMGDYRNCGEYIYIGLYDPEPPYTFDISERRINDVRGGIVDWENLDPTIYGVKAALVAYDPQLGHNVSIGFSETRQFTLNAGDDRLINLTIRPDDAIANKLCGLAPTLTPYARTSMTGNVTVSGLENPHGHIAVVAVKAAYGTRWYSEPLETKLGNSGTNSTTYTIRDIVVGEGYDPIFLFIFTEDNRARLVSSGNYSCPSAPCSNINFNLTIPPTNPSITLAPTSTPGTVTISGYVTLINENNPKRDVKGLVVRAQRVDRSECSILTPELRPNDENEGEFHYSVGFNNDNDPCALSSDDSVWVQALLQLEDGGSLVAPPTLLGHTVSAGGTQQFTMIIPPPPSATIQARYTFTNNHSTKEITQLLPQICQDNICLGDHNIHLSVKPGDAPKTIFHTFSMDAQNPRQPIRQGLNYTLGCTVSVKISPTAPDLEYENCQKKLAIGGQTERVLFRFTLNSDGSSNVTTLSEIEIVDLNGDGVLNAADLSLFLQSYGAERVAVAADLDGNGKVNALDFSRFLRLLIDNFGKKLD